MSHRTDCPQCNQRTFESGVCSHCGFKQEKKGFGFGKSEPKPVTRKQQDK